MSEIKDHLFGTLAIRGHFVTEAQVEEAIAEQQLFEQTGQPVPPLGEVLVQKGYMTIEQVKAVLQGQTNRKAKFGEILIQWKLCSQASVQSALAFQTERRARGEAAPRLGEILVTRGLIKPHQVHAILQTQGKSIVRCPHCQTRYNVSNLIPGGKLNCGRCKRGFAAVPEAPAVSDNGTAKELHSDLTQQLPAVTLDDAPTGPQKIGPYQIMARLGADHSGVLYKAHDAGAQQAVAIRVLSEQIMQGPDDFERWVSAGQAAAELNHPNLQRILTMGSENGRAYLVMEFIEGHSLRQKLRDRGALPLLEAMDILIQVAEALAYGHAHDLLHGDLHPRHILLGQDKRVRLGNLGTPKKIMHDLRLMAQISGSLPLYAAPEVLIDEGEADERSDIYSLCALGYHLVTGKPPLEGRDLLQAGFLAASGNIPSAETLVPAIPSYVSRMLDKGLCSEPEDRYQTADLLLADLRKCRAGAMVQAPEIPEVAPATATPEPPRRAVRMRRRGRPAAQRKGTYIIRKPKPGGAGRGSGIGSGVQSALTPVGTPAVRTGSASKIQPAVRSGSATNLQPAANVPDIGSGGTPAARPVPKRRLRAGMDSARFHFQDLSPFAKAMFLFVPLILCGLVAGTIWYLRPPQTATEPDLLEPQRIEKSTTKTEASDAERRARNDYNVVDDYARKNPSDHAGVVRQIDQFLARHSGLSGGVIDDAKKLRLEFAKAGLQYSLEPHKKKLEELTAAYQFREAQLEMQRWRQLWGDEVAGDAAKQLETWLEERERGLAEDLLSKATRQRQEKDWEGARASCQLVAEHFGKAFSARAMAERRAVDEAEVKAGVNASAEAERERQRLLAEQREAQAPDRYLKLLQKLEPLVSRFELSPALEEIEAQATEYASTTTGPKFQALKDDITRLKGLRTRIIETARQGKMGDMRIEYHQESYPFNDAAAEGPVLNTRNGRVETRWQEFDLSVLMDMANRATDVTQAAQMLDLALFRLYTGQLKDAENTLAKADKLGAVVQPYRNQLAERMKVAPPPPPPPEVQKEPEQDAAVVLALKALGYEITQGVWKFSADRELSAIPSGKDPQGNPSRLMSIRRSLPPFKSLAVEVRGDAEVAGFSFGKGKRWMVAPTGEWQQIVLKIDSVSGRHLFTVNGQPKASVEALEGDAVKDLPEMVYLRALGKSIEFRNLTVDDQVAGGAASQAPVAKPAQDPAAAQALKLLGWEMVGGVWTIEGENHFAAVPDQAHMEVGVKREMATCQSISVELKGRGESAGFSFGIGKRFIVRPTEEWRRLTLVLNENGRPRLLLNGQPVVSIEDATKVISADLTGAFGLRGVGSRIEFRNFRFE